MNLTSKSKTFAFIALLSFLISFFIVTNGFFPYAGISVSLTLFTLLAFFLKKEKHAKTKIFFIFTLLFSNLIMIRSEWFITFLNFIATLFFGSLMISAKPGEELGAIDHLTGIPTLLLKSVFTKSEYFLEQKNVSNKKLHNYLNTIFGILVTLILAIIIIPLLSSTNPFFQLGVNKFLEYFNILAFIRSLTDEIVFTWTVRLFFTVLFTFLLTKILSFMAQKQTIKLPINFDLKHFSLDIPKIFLAGILIIFFITQLQFYFATSETLQKLGLTNSTHAREVFAQLSVVSGILVLLLYNSYASKKKWLDILLMGEGVFLTLMAYISAIEYINNWGFTYKRLYGLTVATWVLGVLTIYFINWQKNLHLQAFVHKTVIFSGVLLLTVNLLNFDYLIYHVRKASTGGGIDHAYMTTLSPDSMSYKDQLEIAKKVMEDPESPNFENYNPLRLYSYVEWLKNKYTQKFDLRNFNLMEYLTYIEIKDTDTNQLSHYFRLKVNSKI